MKKWIGIGLILAMTTTLLAACGNNKDAGSVSKSTTVNEGFTQPVTLTFYNNQGMTQDVFNQTFGDYLKKKMPNVTINYIVKDKKVSLSDLLTSGTKIDIYIDSIGQIGLQGGLLDLSLQQDLTELVKKHNVDLNRFDPTTIDAIKVMGGLYGLPINNSVGVLLYNKDVFDKFDVAYPKDGMTWDQVAEIAKKLTRTEGGTNYVGYSTSIKHFIRVNPLSLVNVDPKTKKASLDTDPGWKKLLQETLIITMQGDTYKTVLDQLSSQWYKVPYVDQFSKDKNVGMFSFLYGNYDWLTTMNGDMVSFPNFSDKPGVGSQPYPTYMFITSTSENKDAAMEVIKQFISDDYQTQQSKLGVITPLKSEAVRSVFGTETKLKNLNIKNAVFYNKPAPAAPKSPYDTFVEDAITANYPDLLTGKTDINTFLRNAEDQVTQNIAKASSK